MRFIKYIDRLNAILGKLVSFLIIPLSLLVSYDVVLRYIFDRPTTWGFDINIMIFGAYLILGGGYTLYANGHIRMDILYSRLSTKGKALMDIATVWFAFLFCSALLWGSGKATWKSLEVLETSGTTLNAPIYPIKIIAFVGICLLLLQWVAEFARNIVILVKGEQSEC